MRKKPAPVRDAIFRFLKIDRGSTAIEYGLIAAGVALAIAGAVAIMGGNIGGVFGSISEITGAADSQGDTGANAPSTVSNPNSGIVLISPQ